MNLPATCLSLLLLLPLLFSHIGQAQPAKGLKGDALLETLRERKVAPDEASSAAMREALAPSFNLREPADTAAYSAYFAGLGAEGFKARKAAKKALIALPENIALMEKLREEKDDPEIRGNAEDVMLAWAKRREAEEAAMDGEANKRLLTHLPMSAVKLEMLRRITPALKSDQRNNFTPTRQGLDGLNDKERREVYDEVMQWSLNGTSTSILWRQVNLDSVLPEHRRDIKLTRRICAWAAEQQGRPSSYMDRFLAKWLSDLPEGIEQKELSAYREKATMAKTAFLLAELRHGNEDLVEDYCARLSKETYHSGRGVMQAVSPCSPEVKTKVANALIANLKKRYGGDNLGVSRMSMFSYYILYNSLYLSEYPDFQDLLTPFLEDKESPYHALACLSAWHGENRKPLRDLDLEKLPEVPIQANGTYNLLPFLQIARNRVLLAEDKADRTHAEAEMRVVYELLMASLTRLRGTKSVQSYGLERAMQTVSDSYIHDALPLGITVPEERLLAFAAWSDDPALAKQVNSKAWSALGMQARMQGRIDALVENALKDFPEEPGPAQLVDAMHALYHQRGHLSGDDSTFRELTLKHAERMCADPRPQHLRNFILRLSPEDWHRFDCVPTASYMLTGLDQKTRELEQFPETLLKNLEPTTCEETLRYSLGLAEAPEVVTQLDQLSGRGLMAALAAAGKVSPELAEASVEAWLKATPSRKTQPAITEIGRIADTLLQADADIPNPGPEPYARTAAANLRLFTALRQENWKAAVTALDEVEALRPATTGYPLSRTAQQWRILFGRMTGEPEEALNDRLIALEQSTSGYNYTADILIAWHLARGENTEAFALLPAQGIDPASVYPSDPTVIFQLAWRLAAAGRDKDAVRCAHTVLHRTANGILARQVTQLIRWIETPPKQFEAYLKLERKERAAFARKATDPELRDLAAWQAVIHDPALAKEMAELADEDTLHGALLKQRIQARPAKDMCSALARHSHDTRPYDTLEPFKRNLGFTHAQGRPFAVFDRVHWFDEDGLCISTGVDIHLYEGWGHWPTLTNYSSVGVERHLTVLAVDGSGAVEHHRLKIAGFKK